MRRLPSLKHTLAGLFAALAAVSAACAADIPTSPFLRIETGMHGASINAVAVAAGDEKDAQLVTVSDDKTIRIWSLQDGALLRTARGPIGNGPEGALYAMALSPSGKTVAAAGYTGLTWNGSAEIYLFNREDGAWVGRLGFGTIPTDTINRIAFSPNGRLIAVAANDKRGLRIIDTVARTVTIADKDYGGAIEWLDFAPDGRLVTSALDGLIRLYDAELKRTATFRMPSGVRPFAVAFNEDGSRIAVGTIDRATVQLLSGRDLKLQATLSGAAARQGGLSLVAWSHDGKRLYGAGTYGDSSGHKLVRAWRVGAAPAAEAEEFGAGSDTVTALQPLADGSLVVATAEPAWGVLAANGSWKLRNGPRQADFRDGAIGGFRVSRDGAVVDFGFAQGGRDRARFDLLAGTLELDPQPRSDLTGAVTKLAKAEISDWRNGTHPKLDGKPLALDANELARSAAIAGDWAVLGADFSLRAYRAGRPVWRTEVPAPVWTLTISGDGRLAIAGLGDGTIRWFRMSDGVQILSLFAEPQGERWVAWTPEGFFDHGKGGETLIGYHLNQLDQGRPHGAAFVAVEQLYALFFRRDLVVAKYRGNAESDIAAQLARIGDVRTVLGRGLPPQIRLTEYCLGGSACQTAAADQAVRGGKGKLDPITVETPEITLHFAVADQGGGVGPIIVRRQGATIAASGGTRSASAGKRDEERVIPLQPGLNLINLSGFNSAREIETSPQERPLLLVRYQPPKIVKPVLHLVAVGIDHFASKDVPALVNAAADARSLAEIMQSDSKHKVFDRIDATVLTDDKASLAAIEQALDDLAARATPDDIAFVFLAGHGVDLDGKYYFLPQDLPDLSPATIRERALTQEALASRLGKLATARATIVLDTCYSGAFAVEDSITRETRDETMGKQISHETGRFILAGSASQEEALDGVDGHGVFTEVLLRGLAGKADSELRGNRDGKVSVYELGEFAKAQVPALASQVRSGHSQKPRWYFTGDDMFDLRDAD